MPNDIFGKYKQLIKMVAYDEMKEVAGEDPRKLGK